MICAHISVVLRSKYVSNYPTLYSTCLHAYRFQVLVWSMLPCGPSQLRLRVRSSCKAEEFSRKEKGDLVGGFEGFCAGNSGFGARGVWKLRHGGSGVQGLGFGA